MHQHPTRDDSEHSSASSKADVDKEIAANALNGGATQPYEEPSSVGHQQSSHDEGRQDQHVDGGQVEKQTTTRSGKAVSVNNISAIPNGGLQAWLQVLGAFFLFFTSWGIVNAVSSILSRVPVVC
jgi:hypothetical protein